MAKNFDLLDDTKLAYEVQKCKCMYGKAYKQHLFFSKKVFYPNQIFLRLDFPLSFSPRGFDNVVKSAFLSFLSYDHVFLFIIITLIISPINYFF